MHHMVQTMEIRTAAQKDDPSTGLSFFEACSDLPAAIESVEVFLNPEHPQACGFAPQASGVQLLFCPGGAVSVLTDTGRERQQITLDRPNAGLLLDVRVWREISWLEPGGVVCAAGADLHDAVWSRDRKLFEQAPAEERGGQPG